MLSKLKTADSKQRKLHSFFSSRASNELPVGCDGQNVHDITLPTKQSLSDKDSSSRQTEPPSIQVEDDEPTAKRPRVTGCDDTVPLPSSFKKKSVPSAADVRELTHSLFKGSVHHHDICEAEGCCRISKTEENRIKSLTYKFQHNWLNKKISFCEKTGIWWVVYVEGEGLYCTLCRKHDTYNPQNKSKTFNEEACTRFRPEAINDHRVTKQHGFAISAELNQRCSYFQKEINEREEVAEEVLLKTFMSLYWVTKEEIANRKITSLLKLLEDLGLEEMRHFRHRSGGSLRDMFLTLGDAIEEDLLSSLRKADHFGLMVDEATDISVCEQMISFIQYYDQDAGEAKTAFLSVDNILEESSSPDAETITTAIIKLIRDFDLDSKKLTSFVSDGASVMTGKNTGVAKRLKDSVNKELLNIHCICHRLALACTDTLQDVSYIKQVQLLLVQLWKLFENSPKKLAVYLKTQSGLKNVQLTTEQSRQKVSKRLQKACQTRWLSFNASIQAISQEYPAVLQTLNALKDSDAAALGLLTKIKDVKFISTVYILAEVLPHLDALSKTFQKDKIDFSQIGPSIDYTVEKLDTIVSSMSPVSKFRNDIASDGKLGICDIAVTDHHIENMKNLLAKYIEGLKVNLERRFEETLPVLTSFSVLDLSKLPNKNHPGFRQYGLRQMDVIAAHFTMNSPEDERPAVLDEMKAEWGKLKYDMLDWKVDYEDYKASEGSTGSVSITSTEWGLQRICQLKPFYPMMGRVADIILSTPVSNAWPERGASALKRIKTRLRSSIKNDMLQALLQISVNGPKPGSEEAKAVIKTASSNWIREKPRRKLPKKADVRNKLVHHQQKAPTTSDAAVQTESVPLTREDIACIIRDEVYAYTKAFNLPYADDQEEDDEDFDDCCGF